MTKTVGNSATLRWFYFFKIATRRELKYLVAVGIHIAFLYLKKTFRFSILHGGKKKQYLSYLFIKASFWRRTLFGFYLIQRARHPLVFLLDTHSHAVWTTMLDDNVFESKVKLIISIGKPKTLLSLCTLKGDVQQTGMECGHMYSSKE